MSIAPLTVRVWRAILLTASHHYCKGWERHGKIPNGQTVIVEGDDVTVHINRRIDRKGIF